jgi:hypothetical protein
MGMEILGSSIDLEFLPYFKDTYILILKVLSTVR